MAWNTPRTWAANEVLTAANMNTYISEDLSYLGTNRPHCQVRDATGPTGTASWVNPSWDAITTNVGTMASSSTGFVRLPTAGFYLIGGSVLFGADGTAGVRGLMLSTSSSGGGTALAQSNTTIHSGNASGATAMTGYQVSGITDIYLSWFVPSGFTGGVTNIRMWAIWMTT